MRARSLIPIAIVVLSMLPAGAQAAPTIAETIEAMTLREKVGQLVMFSVAGKGLSAAEAKAISKNHLGGVILFAKNYTDRSQLEQLNRQIQKAVRRGNDFKIGALISADQEGGVVKRFPDMPPAYSAPRMGEIGKTSVALAQGRKTAKALKGAGVNVNLAPVGDLDIGPSHVMAERSFGANRYVVARLASAFGDGLQDKRVAAAAKHFPGFGGASMNSDDGAAYVRRSKKELHQVDALPFHRMIAHGIRMMMVSHGMYVKDGGKKPASLSYYITTERLRDEFGFTGVAISDDLVAIAWRFDGDTPLACKATVRAGMDVALITGGPEMARACAERIYGAVRDGDIPKVRIDEAVERVLKLKKWLKVFAPG